MDQPAPQIPRLIFDGDCAFCTSVTTWMEERLHRPDGLNAETVPWQYTDLAAIGTDERRARREVLFVDHRGQLHGGAQAFAQWLIFRGLPYSLLGEFITLPVVRTIAAGVYRLVAANRSHLPGGTPACALPPPGATPRS
ncbi:putative DCC family thiol-disulfide oxidoreductase YuxK [Friedmanniella endophytica]|uniref:Putative DCC family thiol-disulfide oxidoreductase YuxK n=1 Tax=Microlunatus kandeliicorticis TaxID=1759536 RepID=A0A7W3IV88_9ACTN|nr:DUF393 domain-containing protein [Microlunatus kandeliicorticis]MBA8795800.1 putative DCC family thiol-disulfide oxidoreductase YuxK [Microlunatus kandeliicorticis]